ncbi:MAG: hypothetical protein ACC707_20640 [Thiohalomonadales bacterium]
MSNLVAVLFNGIAQFEFDRERSLTPQQSLYLTKMDSKMDEGIQMDSSFITKPDINNRTQYVAANLANAIIHNDEATCSALCSYLAVRLPELKQVKIDEKDGEISIELVFDEDYQKQVPVTFLH